MKKGFVLFVFALGISKGSSQSWKYSKTGAIMLTFFFFGGGMVVSFISVIYFFNLLIIMFCYYMLLPKNIRDFFLEILSFL